MKQGVVLTETEGTVAGPPTIASDGTRVAYWVMYPRRRTILRDYTTVIFALDVDPAKCEAVGGRGSWTPTAAEGADVGEEPARRHPRQPPADQPEEPRPHLLLARDAREPPGRDADRAGCGRRRRTATTSGTSCASRGARLHPRGLRTRREEPHLPLHARRGAGLLRHA